MSSQSYFLGELQSRLALFFGLLVFPGLFLCCHQPSRRATLPQLGTRMEVSPGLVVYANNVRRLAKETRDAYGFTAEFNEFEVQATVSVQVREDPMSMNNNFQAARARFLIGLAEDPEGVYCSNVSKVISDYWQSKDMNYIRSYRLLPADKHAYLFEGRYVMYERPEDNWPGSYWLFYVEGVLVRIELSDYERAKGVGALDSFVAENLVFRLGGRDFRPSHKSLLPPETFLDLYRKGALCSR